VRAGLAVLALLLGLLAGCGMLPIGTAAPAGDEAARLAAAAERWAGQGIRSYTIRLQLLCECDLAGDPLDVVVVDGVATRATSGGQDVPLERLAVATVDDMFAKARSALSGGGRVEGRYDGATGVPLSLLIDPVPNAIDDEVTVTVQGFAAG
jgi:Family of unknown function (DUF6174)